MFLLSNHMACFIILTDVPVFCSPSEMGVVAHPLILNGDLGRTCRPHPGCKLAARLAIGIHLTLLLYL